MSEFKPFDDRLNGLIAALSPAARRKLAGEIAKELRKSQQQRIKLQKAPDGSPYQARKRQPLRAKTGRIKRAMFQKLRTSRYMKATGRENALWWNLPAKCSASRGASVWVKRPAKQK
jgi:phage virion morphogenesis protein